MHPACPVILVSLRKRMIPIMLEIHGINTPLIVPSFLALWPDWGERLTSSWADEVNILTGRPRESIDPIVSLDVSTVSTSLSSPPFWFLQKPCRNLGEDDLVMAFVIHPKTVQFEHRRSEAGCQLVQRVWLSCIIGTSKFRESTEKVKKAFTKINADIYFMLNVFNTPYSLEYSEYNVVQVQGTSTARYT